MPIDYELLSPIDRQRLPEYTRDDPWIKAFLHRSLIGQVAHLHADQPYVTPTNFFYDESRNRIVFHSNITGRMRWNLDQNPKVCFVTSEHGRFLPSNAALEFSIQYRSVMVFGHVHVITDRDEQKLVLTAFIGKYFPNLRSGYEYRPITENELRRTGVYAINIDSWSGKENWQDEAEQIPEWAPLPDHVR
jgi:nitroimidazol reductase NimA-like FMN-containing flavoprotein (pyridoxamine 5'-phosphate oxidase superfamily)